MDVRLHVRQLLVFPWRNTLAVLRERFREDQLGLTASSLTFTTTIALVPFFTVVLAVFTAFPMFSQLQTALQKWLIESLIPDSIARQVMGYLTQFAAKSSRLGVAGLAALLLTALALILTIDQTLNRIWRVRRTRPLGQRILVYWSALTLGPVLLAAILAMASYLFSASSGWVGSGAAANLLRWAFTSIEFLLLAAGAAALFHYVPNTRVQRSHAWAGGLFVAVGIELAKKLLAWYFTLVPSYSAVYGAFATLPILLTWIYITWVIVLLGAVTAAYLPSLLMGVPRRGGTPGWNFQLALELLHALERSRRAGQAGLSQEALAQQLQVDLLAIEPVLAVLQELDWVGQLADTPGRHVLLVEPAAQRIGPLMERLLLPREGSPPRLWQQASWPQMSLAEVWAEPAGHLA